VVSYKGIRVFTDDNIDGDVGGKEVDRSFEVLEKFVRDVVINGRWKIGYFDELLLSIVNLMDVGWRDRFIEMIRRVKEEAEERSEEMLRRYVYE